MSLSMDREQSKKEKEKKKPVSNKSQFEICDLKTNCRGKPKTESESRLSIM